MDPELLGRCPGCGPRLPIADAPRATLLDCSPGCWQRYGELAAYTLSQSYDEFIHQLAVDAYAAQHAGPSARPITIAFALAGLYLAVERGYTGREVQRAHQRLARGSKNWPSFGAPRVYASVTVADVLAADPGDARDAAIRQWAAAVWLTWHEARPDVLEFVRERLGHQCGR